MFIRMGLIIVWILVAREFLASDKLGEIIDRIEREAKKHF